MNVQFKTIEAADREWFAALAVVIFFAFFIFKRMTRRKSDDLVRLEVSDRELVFNGRNGRTALLWSGFSQCLESPNLFVLLDRPKTILYAVPKRAFPNDAAQDWFRAQATQIQSEAPAAAGDETFVPGRFAAANGIAFTLQLKYRDYLSRNFTSWRMRGIFLGIFALVIGTSLYSMAHPPPDAVVPPGKVFLIMISILSPMLVVVFFIACFISWRGERKFLKPQQIVLTSEGIEFASHDSAGRLAWNTYKYYHENRWSFFVWNPRGSLWLMFPKRVFASSEIDRFRDWLRTNLKASRWFYL